MSVQRPIELPWNNQVHASYLRGLVKLFGFVLTELPENQDSLFLGLILIVQVIEVLELRGLNFPRNEFEWIFRVVVADFSVEVLVVFKDNFFS